MAEKVQNIVIDWSDVKWRFIRCVEKGERWQSQRVMGDRLATYHNNPYEEHKWEGGKPSDVLQNLREGFHAPEFAHAAEYVPIAMKLRNSWNEEDGDVDPGRLLAGRDDFFLGAQKRLAKPGLRVQIEFAFAWTVSAKTIQEYGAWVAGFLGSLESSGFDIIVDMWQPLDSLFKNDGWETRTNVLTRVKRPNEVSDFTEWSALFAPTGFRMLGFTALCVAGDKIGKVTDDSLGNTIGGKTWGVEYDRDEATVRITCNQRAGKAEKFPKELLNQQAIEAGLIPSLIAH
jgi:hypothetical protein